LIESVVVWLEWSFVGDIFYGLLLPACLHLFFGAVRGMLQKKKGIFLKLIEEVLAFLLFSLLAVWVKCGLLMMLLLLLVEM
jgi:hypothetical protein